MHILKVRLRIDKPVSIHIDADTVLLTFFCCYHKNTISGQSSIDTAGSSIFQNSDRLYIIRINLIQCHTGRYVINNDEGLSTHIVRESAYTTQDRTALSCIRVDIKTQTCYLSFQRTKQVFMHLLIQFLTIYKAEGSCSIGSFDGLITSHHHVVKHRLIVLQNKSGYLT